MLSRKLLPLLSALTFTFESQAATLVPQTSRPSPGVTESDADRKATIARAPAVFEEVHHVWTFRKDGTGRRETHVRARIQYQAAVQELGQLKWGFNSANETFDLLHVRVIKPDGKIVSAGNEAVQEITSSLPFGSSTYTDFREKHVVVPALSPGDVLEFACAVNLIRPHTPGHFWGQHQFALQGVCLSETFEIRHPADCDVRFKVRPELKGQETTDGDTKVHRWTHSHVDVPPPERQDEMAAHFKRQMRVLTQRLETPDVQFTTFRTWGEVGDWYASLERPQRSLSLELQNKVEALLQGMGTDLDKAGAIYGFVTQEFRYLGLSFGQGRYQPHAAHEVFANRYGDCKDKGTLLATMLGRAGFTPELALCNSSRNVDPDVPSPAQFEHLIVRVPQSGSPLWLDATAPTAPFRALAPQLRGKLALVVRPGTASSLERVPEDAPFPTFQNLDAEGSVDESGILNLKTRIILRTDSEAQVRWMLRNAPPEERNRIFSVALGLSGQVVDVQSKHLDILTEPLELIITSKDESFLDLSKRDRLTPKVPLPKLEQNSVDEDDAPTAPFLLAPALSQQQRLTLSFPKGTKLQPPLPISQNRGYGRFASTYKVEGERVEFQRTLALTSSRLDPKLAQDWRAFQRSVDADQDQTLRVQLPPGGTPAPISNTPRTGSLNVETMYKNAIAVQDQGNYPSALQLWEQLIAVTTEHQKEHQNALNNMGRCFRQLQLHEKAEQAFRKVIALDPYQPFAHNNLGDLLFTLNRTEEAEASFRKQIEVSPLDEFAHANLGALLLQAKRFEEARSELEQAWQITPDNFATGIRLGESLLHTGKGDVAKLHFEQLATKGTSPGLWNEIAYTLCENGGDLQMALRLAEGSLNGLATQLASTSLKNNPSQQFGLTLSGAATLDTLGWVHFRLGNLDQALKFVGSAHVLRASPAIAEHLGILYERIGDSKRAMAVLSQALLPPKPLRSLNSEDPFPRIQALLEKLAGSPSKARAALERAKGVGFSDRLVKVPGSLKKDVTGYLFLALDDAGHVLESTLLQSDADFQALLPNIQKMTFPIGLPANCALKRVVRVAQVVAVKASGEVCLYFLENVPSLP